MLAKGRNAKDKPKKRLELQAAGSNLDPNGRAYRLKEI